MLVDGTELIGTNGLVAKKIQAKFYIDGDVLGQCGKVFDRQGVSFTVGMTRLVELLLDVPEEMTPLLLRQAPGNAAKALAEYSLRMAVVRTYDTGKVAKPPAPSGELASKKVRARTG